jgi:hypothetical protein
MTRTIGAAIGALLVAFLLAAIGARMARPASAYSAPAKVVSQR